MLALRKNIFSCVRNQSRIRKFTSSVSFNGSGNHLITRTSLEFPIRIFPNRCYIQRIPNCIQRVHFSSESNLSQLDYEHFCAETLDDLNDYFEALIESVNDLATADVVNKDGVLTVSLGSTHGTYVINKQSPNKQIWLSSPRSGPKRFDFVYAWDGSKNGYWFYKHSGETLHELLDTEFSEITKTKTKFQSLAFGTRY